MDLPPRKALVAVLGLAKEALDIQTQFKQFIDSDHPYGQQLRCMTPPVALAYLLRLTKNRSVLTGTEAKPSIPAVPASSPTPKASTRSSRQSRALTMMHFEDDEIVALSTLPPFVPCYLPDTWRFKSI